MTAVGEQGEADALVGLNLGKAEVAQHLGRRRRAASRAVKGCLPRLSFEEGGAVPIAPILRRLSLGQAEFRRRKEQQIIGNVRSPGWGKILLGQSIAPTQKIEDGFNHQSLGRTFVHTRRRCCRVDDNRQRGACVGDIGRRLAAPLRQVFDAGTQKIVAE